MDGIWILSSSITSYANYPKGSGIDLYGSYFIAILKFDSIDFLIDQFSPTTGSIFILNHGPAPVTSVELLAHLIWHQDITELLVGSSQLSCFVKIGFQKAVTILKSDQVTIYAIRFSNFVQKGFDVKIAFHKTYGVAAEFTCIIFFDYITVGPVNTFFKVGKIIHFGFFQLDYLGLGNGT